MNTFSITEAVAPVYSHAFGRTLSIEELRHRTPAAPLTTNARRSARRRAPRPPDRRKGFAADARLVIPARSLPGSGQTGKKIPFAVDESTLSPVLLDATMRTSCNPAVRLGIACSNKNPVPTGIPGYSAATSARSRP